MFIYAVVFGLLPDILGEGLMFSFSFMGLDNMPGFEHGHPDITDFPLWAQSFYNTSHSLLVFILIFAVVWIIRKRPFWPLAAWGIHIIIDIPTHSIELFPTPFLWPISSFKVDGLGWDNPYILVPNFTLLLIVYLTWWYRRRAIRRSKPTAQ
ncbi:MAG: hypothetical protein JSU74_03635 [Candidatus Zixiibacteriota bacterium]|nr:MAG: hypothetical protein JSU74_03635 [candidate division Zixibacteria bacterium]